MYMFIYIHLYLGKGSLPEGKYDWPCHTKSPVSSLHLSWQGMMRKYIQFKILRDCLFVLLKNMHIPKIEDMNLLHPTFFNYRKEWSNWHLSSFLPQLLVINATWIPTIIIYSFLPEPIINTDYNFPQEKCTVDVSSAQLTSETSVNTQDPEEIDSLFCS